MSDESVYIIALDDNSTLDKILEKLDKSIYVLTTSGKKMSEVVETMRERRGEDDE